MNRSLFTVLLMGAALPLVAGAQTVRMDQRQAIQQKQIDEGVRRGDLTQSEADRLQKNQQRIQKMEDKAKADGVITLKERQRIDRAQDNHSRSIQRESHDRQRAGNEGKRNSEREQRERQRN